MNMEPTPHTLRYGLDLNDLGFATRGACVKTATYSHSQRQIHELLRMSPNYVKIWNTTCRARWRNPFYPAYNRSRRVKSNFRCRASDHYDSHKNLCTASIFDIDYDSEVRFTLHVEL